MIRNEREISLLCCNFPKKCTTLLGVRPTEYDLKQVFETPTETRRKSTKNNHNSSLKQIEACVQKRVLL